MEEVHKKSLKEVLPKSGLELGIKKTSATRRIKTEPTTSVNYQTDKFPPKRFFSSSSYFFWTCLILVFLAGGYYLSTVFATVTLKLTPRQAITNINGSFEANVAPADSGLEFSVMKLEETQDREVPAMGQKKVEVKASGVVTITNNYSSSPQALVVNTRLETKNGLIFRLANSVTVPGQTKKGTTIIPGSISVKVVADQVGSSYNVGDTTFKIVGFKGTTKYDKFTVQSKTAIGGGKTGMISVIKDEDQAEALKILEKELKDKVAKKAKSQIPKDFMFFDDGVITKFSNEVKESGSSTKAIISAKVTMTAILFNTKNISEYFAAKQFPDENIDGVKISNLTTLNFALSDKEQFAVDKTSKIKFNLSGKANLVWPINTIDLKQKLLGSSIRKKDQIFANYPAIYRAEAVVRPPWVLSFPNQADKINIKLMVE